VPDSGLDRSIVTVRRPSLKRKIRMDRMHGAHA
jgi:hypothetical protein